MRTNIVLDNTLVKRAMKLTGNKTKRGVVNEALKELIRIRGQAAIRELRGKIQWEGNLDEMRGA